MPFSVDQRNHAVDAVKATGLLPHGFNDGQSLALVDAVLSTLPDPDAPKPAINVVGLIFNLMAHNSADLEDIIRRIGGMGNAMAIVPDILRIVRASLDTAARSPNPHSALASLAAAPRR